MLISVCGYTVQSVTSPVSLHSTQRFLLIEQLHILHYVSSSHMLSYHHIWVVNLEKNGGGYQILIGKSMKCNKQNHFHLYQVNIMCCFYFFISDLQCYCLISNCLIVSLFRFQNFFTGQTDRLTDKPNCLTPLCKCVCMIIRWQVSYYSNVYGTTYLQHSSDQQCMDSTHS